MPLRSNPAFCIDSFVEVTQSAPPHQRPTLADLTQREPSIISDQKKLIKLEIDRNQPLAVTRNRDPNEVSAIEEDSSHEEEILPHELEPNGAHK
jgi:hypothetical protein